MKALCCLLFILASFESYAQVRENIKVKHQSQTRGKHVPEKFVVEETTTSNPSSKVSNSNKKKGLRK